ncbi:MAG: hypothetical protein IBJ10_05495 [Phycisphaerales bacterium]|nr:hypothetical protein [Phycisphaerales bacterium]
MLILQPHHVTLLGEALPGVDSIAVSRSASKFVVERADAGPHPVFADAPEQAVEVVIVRTLDGPSPDAPAPGRQGALAFVAAPSGADGPSRRVSATVVVRSSRVEASGRRGASQRIELLALSPDGAADPISIQEFRP